MLFEADTSSCLLLDDDTVLSIERSALPRPFRTSLVALGTYDRYSNPLSFRMHGPPCGGDALNISLVSPNSTPNTLSLPRQLRNED